MPGAVFTFYSYKGGVGRSFTLANIAVLLARWGHRVLCLDWDLEAPGLADYFRDRLPRRPDGGVVDLVADFRQGRFAPETHALRLKDVGALDFIAAGREEDGYVGQVQEIDWEVLYEDGFGEYLDKCREQWAANYDFVLIDSRTGISDIGGICTAHLPDHLVVLFTANRQSIRGATDLARRADAARNLLPFDRARLTVLPVLSRFDNREEYDRSETWRRIVVDETAELYRTWLDQTVEPATMARHLTLPYVSYWSFGEQLPVLSEQTPSADQIGFALETVAAVIACRLDRTDLLAENRDAYVAAVRARRQEFRHDLRVSTPRPAFETATELVTELEARGVRAVKSLSGDRSLLARVEDDARHLCLVVDGKVSRWQAAEVELFLHRTLGQDRRVIPVLTPGTEPTALPGYVGNLRYLRLSGTRGPAEVARDLVAQLKGLTPLVEADDDVDLATLLGQARGARLRPSRWDLVDELVTALQPAVGAGDADRTRDLATDLAVAIKPRPPNGDTHLAAPVKLRRSIDWLLSILEARARTTTKPNHRKDLG
ncbi:CobQ/CobB/MinD/ParA nucleotide binding domain-containing protein [Amycolatopsis pretoriensis]|uniref:CobQ/CobB/MinD/ParA nucleotide binding domain-containing protein n=1 Tax=Amycolatopsis pretoriensis TaxID=218821 RepID=A0A1H5Q7U5_9PSEU|nr:CATRA system-associated protein [Amycolatopsis pretoriensis]SEF21501.1 CobQ/CobB/MinD/ParA nucleotide binding domain-containing protein [Amycolatopsis pretoriensis]